MKESNTIKCYQGTEISSSNLLTKIYNNPEDLLTKSLLHIIDAGGPELLVRLGAEFEIPIPEKFIQTTSQTPFRPKEDLESGSSRPDGLIFSMPFLLMVENKLSEKATPESILKEKGTGFEI